MIRDEDSFVWDDTHPSITFIKRADYAGTIDYLDIAGYDDYALKREDVIALRGLCNYILDTVWPEEDDTP